MSERWSYGDLIVRRERLGLVPAEVSQTGPAAGVWLEAPVFVVEDTADHLVSYMATGARFGFPPGRWPTPDGDHPWRHKGGRWMGHGCLMVQQPDDHVAVWHFWDGTDREFVCWYLNLQTAVARTPDGYDTQDLELDIVVFPDGSHVVKDAEVLDDRVSDGRWSPELVEWIRSYGDELVGRLESDGPWWDRTWARWTPPSHWVDPTLPGIHADNATS
jgi:hypothetical protein